MIIGGISPCGSARLPPSGSSTEEGDLDDLDADGIAPRAKRLDAGRPVVDNFAGGEFDERAVEVRAGLFPGSDSMGVVEVIEIVRGSESSPSSESELLGMTGTDRPGTAASWTNSGLV